MSEKQNFEKIDDYIKAQVKEQIYPNLNFLLTRSLVVHLLTTLFVLVICPQLGIQLAHSPINFSHMLMMYGKEICDLFCGILFISLSLSSNFLIMTKDEFRYLRYNKWPFFGLILLSSFGLLFSLNTNLFYELTFYWILGLGLGFLITYFTSILVMRRA